MRVHGTDASDLVRELVHVMEHAEHGGLHLGAAFNEQAYRLDAGKQGRRSRHFVLCHDHSSPPQLLNAVHFRSLCDLDSVFRLCVSAKSNTMHNVRWRSGGRVKKTPLAPQR